MARIKSITLRDPAGKPIDGYGWSATSPVEQPPQPPRPPGLGDLVATFAQPIAAVIDRITDAMLSPEHKTALQGCSACGRRQNKLNLLCPDIRTCPFLGKLVEMLPASARGALLDAAQKRIKAG